MTSGTASAIITAQAGKPINKNKNWANPKKAAPPKNKKKGQLMKLSKTITIKTPTRRISSTPPAESAVAAGNHCRLARLLLDFTSFYIAITPYFLYTARSLNRSESKDITLHAW